MTILTMQRTGNIMRGKPVLLSSRTLLDIGRSHRRPNKAVVGIYYDVTGYDNGSQTWVNVNLLGHSFNFFILNINQFASEERR